MPENKKKPVWLLDVDGVINAVTAGTPSSKITGLTDWKIIKSGMGYGIWFSPTVTKFIADTHNSGRAEVNWLTTWEEHANEHLIVPLELPKLALAGPRPVPEPMNWWKYYVARNRIADDVPLIWTDDDLDYASANNEGGINEWLENRGPTLAISPNPYTGLRPHHLDLISNFIYEYS